MMKLILRNLIITAMVMRVAVMSLSLALNYYADYKLNQLDGWKVEHVTEVLMNDGTECNGLTYPKQKLIKIYNEDGFTYLHEVGHAYSVDVELLHPDHDTTPVWFKNNSYMHTNPDELSANAYVEQWLF